MTLWLLLAAITALALALMLRPLLWGRRSVTSREALETAIYRDRLSEVKRDLERGLLSPAEAEAAEAEISRRMLMAADARQSAAKVLRLDPFFKIESYGTGFRNPSDRQKIIAGLQKAGLK